MYSRTNKKNKTKKNINKTIKTINKISNKITNKISSELSIDATSNISNLINYKRIFWILVVHVLAIIKTGRDITKRLIVL